MVVNSIAALNDSFPSMDDIASTMNSAAAPDSSAIAAKVRRGLDPEVSLSKEWEFGSDARQPSCLLEERWDDDE